MDYNLVDIELYNRLQAEVFNDALYWGDASPAFAENNIAICMASSNEYSPFISVIMQSIMHNSKPGCNYDFNILHTEISPQNQRLITESASGFERVSLRFVNVDEYIRGLTFYTWAHFNKATYYRLLVPYIFHRFPKVLYLDSDIVVNHDISELFETDITGYLAGAARDTHMVGRCMEAPRHEAFEYCTKTLALEHPENYFQCGVLLYNIPEMLKAFPSGRLIIEGAARKLQWLDQDLLNIMLAGRVRLLPNHWNVMIFNNEKIDEYNLEGEIHLDYFTARENPRIVHYVGRNMPCYRPSVDMYWYFWPYARNTPFYELLVSRMVDEKIRLAHIKEQQLKKLESKPAEKPVEKPVEEPAEEPGRKPVEKHGPDLKKTVKNRVVMPVVNLLLPRSSRRRQAVKRLYYRLRGWA